MQIAGQEVVLPTEKPLALALSMHEANFLNLDIYKLIRYSNSRQKFLFFIRARQPEKTESIFFNKTQDNFRGYFSEDTLNRDIDIRDFRLESWSEESATWIFVRRKRRRIS